MAGFALSWRAQTWRTRGCPTDPPLTSHAAQPGVGRAPDVLAACSWLIASSLAITANIPVRGACGETPTPYPSGLAPLWSLLMRLWLFFRPLYPTNDTSTKCSSFDE